MIVLFTIKHYNAVIYLIINRIKFTMQRMRRQSQNNRIYENTTKALNQCSCENYFMQKVFRVLHKNKNHLQCYSKNKGKRGIQITSSKHQFRFNNKNPLKMSPNRRLNDTNKLSANGVKNICEGNLEKSILNPSMNALHVPQFLYPQKQRACEIAFRENNAHKGELTGNKSSSNRTLLSTKYSRDESKSQWMSPHISKVEEEERKGITGFTDIREVHTVVQGSMGTINEEMSDIVLEESIIEWRQSQKSPFPFF